MEVDGGVLRSCYRDRSKLRSLAAFVVLADIKVSNLENATKIIFISPIYSISLLLVI